MQRMVSFVAAFVLVVGITPASAQVGLLGGRWPSSWEGWLYSTQGNQVMVLQESNIRLVEQLMGSGRRASLRRVTDDMAYYGGYYGLKTPQGQEFYPMYRCGKGQRIARYAVKSGSNAALVRLASGQWGWESVIAGGLGALEAFVEDGSCRAINNTNVQIVGLEDDGTMVVQPPMGSPMAPAPSGRPRNGWDDRLRRHQ